jgi:hypothetical protein
MTMFEHANSLTSVIWRAVSQHARRHALMGGLGAQVNLNDYSLMRKIFEDPGWEKAMRPYRRKQSRK